MDEFLESLVDEIQESVSVDREQIRNVIIDSNYEIEKYYPLLINTDYSNMKESFVVPQKDVIISGQLIDQIANKSIIKINNNQIQKENEPLIHQICYDMPKSLVSNMIRFSYQIGNESFPHEIRLQNCKETSLNNTGKNILNTEKTERVNAKYVIERLEGYQIDYDRKWAESGLFAIKINGKSENVNEIEIIRKIKPKARKKAKKTDLNDCMILRNKDSNNYSTLYLYELVGKREVYFQSGFLSDGYKFEKESFFLIKESDLSSIIQNKDQNDPLKSYEKFEAYQYVDSNGITYNIPNNKFNRLFLNEKGGIKRFALQAYFAFGMVIEHQHDIKFGLHKMKESFKIFLDYYQDEENCFTKKSFQIDNAYLSIIELQRNYHKLYQMMFNHLFNWHFLQISPLVVFSELDSIIKSIGMKFSDTKQFFEDQLPKYYLVMWIMLYPTDFIQRNEDKELVIPEDKVINLLNIYKRSILCKAAILFYDLIKRQRITFSTYCIILPIFDTSCINQVNETDLFNDSLETFSHFNIYESQLINSITITDLIHYRTEDRQSSVFIYLNRYNETVTFIYNSFHINGELNKERIIFWLEVLFHSTSEDLLLYNYNLAFEIETAIYSNSIDKTDVFQSIERKFTDKYYEILKYFLPINSDKITNSLNQNYFKRLELVLSKARSAAERVIPCLLPFLSYVLMMKNLSIDVEEKMNTLAKIVLILKNRWGASSYKYTNWYNEEKKKDLNPSLFKIIENLETYPKMQKNMAQ